MICLKIFYVALLCFVYTFGLPSSRNDLSISTYQIDIKTVLEDLIKKLENHDPYNIDELFLPFDLPELVGNMTTSNVTIEFFSNLKINNAELGAAHFEGETYLDKFHVFYNYKGYGLFYQFIPMWGDGISDIYLEGATIGVHTDVLMPSLDEPIIVEGLKLKLKLDDCKIEITGLLDNPDLGKITAAALTDFIMIAVNEKNEFINKKFGPIVEEAANNLLVYFNITPRVILGLGL